LNSVVERIRAEISARGVIPFARFMELALYCPDCGYYEKENDNIGRRGDFYTSVSVGPLFGHLLAFQFAKWLEEIPAATGQLVEVGAHDGRLAADILEWLKQWRPEVFDRLEYIICEPSRRRRDWQLATVRAFLPRVRWLETAWPPKADCFHGVIFSNELLDAMPPHRVGWNAQRREWFEWGVLVDGDDFVWKRMEESDFLSAESLGLRRLSELPDELLGVLPDDFTTEICPAAENWWRDAGAALQRGRLMTLDYGLSAEDFFAPRRAGGTLRGYHRHKFCEDLLANAGDQDLTAHVNFSAIQKAGEAAGLKTERFTTQADFFAGIMKEFWPEAERRSAWTSERSREFQTLVHPEHLGRAFRILVQSR
jgi:SAM-dependent MidA family methyltransferase